VTSPDDAVARARAAAAEARARGDYQEPKPSFEVEPASRINDWRLMEWAMIEPDAAVARSTRRLGAPITWLKRGLLRLLRQYNDDIAGQQSRFNAHVAAHVMSLDDRVRALEEEAAARRTPDRGDGETSP
jgi:hypothetical protein